MDQENRCPQCGAEMAADVPQGLCPACLLKRGLETQSGGGGSQPGPAADVPPTPAELAPLFPDLEILELLGQGGMGVVYKARQKHLDRLVALKILSPRIARDPAFAERFAREARAMALLSHPQIVAVHDFGQTTSPLLPGEGQGEGRQPSSPLLSGEGQGEGRLYYFLMEFVDGVSLRQLLDAKKLSPQEALAIVPQICDALQYAHNAGVVHRDIKPENVLLDKNGRVKIADFGLAKLVGRDPKDLALTGTGQVMGTPHYMAPEQLEHPQDVDHRADIYSLGVVFYQMLTGELPLGRFAPPSTKVQIDVRLDEVVLRALEKEPERRYQQVSDLKTRVETIVQTSPAAAAHSPAPAGAPGESAAEAAGGPSTWPRFSRLAIAGAVWASLFPIVPVFAYWLSRSDWSAGPEPAPAPTLEQQALNTIAILLLVAVFAPTVTAPFGTTILGAVSISQIRHSAGRLYGLGLALFDALLFPLLALDAAIVAVAWALCGVGSATYLPDGSVAAPKGEQGTVLLVGFGILLAIALAIDYLIARWAWRAVNRPVGAGPRGRAAPASAGPAPSAADRPPPNGTSVAFAWIALGLFVAGLLGGAGIAALRAEAGMIFGLSCECLALVFGILGRRHRAGKVALIGWAVLLVWCSIQYIIFLNVRAEKFNEDEFQYSSYVTTTATGIWRVQWGEQGGIVRYMAFVKDGTHEPRELVSVAGRSPQSIITLAVSEGRAEPLPPSANVFELIDGRFRQQWVDVSVDQAKRFCDSKQGEYTIDSLNAFLKRPVGAAQSRASAPPPASGPHDQPAPSNPAISRGTVTTRDSTEEEAHDLVEQLSAALAAQATIAGARGEGASGRAAETDMKALEGEWAGVSYDFDGKENIPLKGSEELKLTLVRSQIAGCFDSIYQKPGLQDVPGENKQNYTSSGNALFQLQPKKGKPGSGLLEAVSPDAVVPNIGVHLVIVPVGIAYSVDGAGMTARFFWKRQKRQVVFTAKKGEPNIVFHLKRVEKATPSANKQQPELPGGDGAKGKAPTGEGPVPGPAPTPPKGDGARPGGAGASTPRLEKVLDSWVRVGSRATPPAR